ncbi:type I pantothenate kinase [Notoacmeibacter marinus]|uniref:Pantothenate kinase n=1 Tax=Notoacmeibacter marinus TaxID=1876515 RepID=A0A231V286_9HYPH|nr:type I pantothenate kinase [Notoacmeibacter marinus]OXT02227.1 type I pantothenate kinase [Notoacmeibacter marinus]
MTLQIGGEAGYHLRPTDGHATGVSPYRTFTAQQWSAFRADTPLTLNREELERLRSLGDPIDMDEVRRIYLSLSRLLSAHVEATQLLFAQRAMFLNATEAVKTPFIIGVAGSVAVGKSTTARILKELLARWPSSPKVDLVTTDGFLLPNAVLEREGLMDRKGFPESYDVAAVLRFLSAIKSGERHVSAPVYSHVTYDVVPDRVVDIETPDILIFEGINVLQTRDLPSEGRIVPFVSDFFDFAIYIDADEALIRNWYVDRFMDLRLTAFTDPKSYFHRYSTLGVAEARRKAETLWETINRRNLIENILPTRPRADLILRKGTNHLVESVSLRKL